MISLLKWITAGAVFNGVSMVEKINKGELAFSHARVNRRISIEDKEFYFLVC